MNDSNQILPDYPATITGQQAFFTDLLSTIQQVPNHKGIGVFYWEPEAISAPTLLSGWENLTLFDFQGNTLSSIQAFEPPQIQMNIQRGWNIISLPVTSFQKLKNVHYPTSSSSAFQYVSNGYVLSDTLAQGSGYWLKFPTDQTIMVEGDSISTITIPVTAGWNLIGSISSPLPTNQIVQIPAENILSDFFDYQRGYFSTDTLKPGKGYWVKVLEAGEFLLSK